MQKEKTTLYVYKAPDSIKNSVAIIICPGGSYGHLGGIKWEGFEVAKWLNSYGISAFVLRYRVNNQGYYHPAMLQDIQRAIQWVREHANEYQITPDHLGVMGFSAGGHLALMSSVFYHNNYLNDVGIQTNVSLKPDFIVPVYPVVSMQDELAHQRSRKNLLGKNVTQKEKDFFSMEMQVSNGMSPVFLVTSKNDPVVKYQNSIVLEQKLTESGIPHQFVLYETGGHGYGMSKRRGGEAAGWNVLFLAWLKSNGFMK